MSQIASASARAVLAGEIPENTLNPEVAGSPLSQD
jgi:hypothetical protein